MAEVISSAVHHAIQTLISPSNSCAIFGIYFCIFINSDARRIKLSDSIGIGLMRMQLVTTVWNYSKRTQSVKDIRLSQY